MAVVRRRGRPVGAEAGRAVQRGDEAPVLRPQRLGDDRDLVDVAGALLVAVDLLKADQVGADGACGGGQRSRLGGPRPQTHAVQQVEGGDPRRRVLGHDSTVRVS